MAATIAKGCWLDGDSAAPSALVEAVLDEWFRAWRLGKAANSVKAIESQVKVDILPAWGRPLR